MVSLTLNNNQSINQLMGQSSLDLKQQSINQLMGQSSLDLKQQLIKQ
jgi:hypothetical protein